MRALLLPAAALAGMALGVGCAPDVKESSHTSHRVESERNVHPYIKLRIAERNEVVLSVIDGPQGLQTVVHGDEAAVNVRTSYQTSPDGLAFFTPPYTASGEDLRASFMSASRPPARGLEAAMEWLEGSSGRISTDGAPSTLHVFYDPLCAACQALYRELSAHGAHQIHYVPVAILADISRDIGVGALQLAREQGAKAAMQALQDPGQRVDLVKAGSGREDDRNELAEAASRFHIQATPTLVWRDRRGDVKAQVGPRGPYSMLEILQESSADGPH